VIVSDRMKLLGWQAFTRLVITARPSTTVLVLTDGRAGDRWSDGSSRVELASRAGFGARQLGRLCQDRA